MAGGGVGEAALLEAVMASEIAGAAVGGAELAGGIGALAGAGELAGLSSAAGGIGALEGAGLAAEGAGGLPSILQGTSVLNPEIASATQAAMQPGVASAMGQPSMFPTESMLSQAEIAQNAGQVSQFSPAGVGGEFNVVGPQGTAEIMQGVNPDFTRGFLPETVDPNAAISKLAEASPDLTMGPASPYPTPGGVNFNDAMSKAMRVGDPTMSGRSDEKGLIDQMTQAWDKLPTMAKYGLGAMGAVKGINYLDGNKYGTPEKEKYEGPLSKFKYDPSRYSPLVPQPRRMAGGGLSDLGGYADYARGGRMLKGPGDGMSDSIPATIAGKQPARLANDEFVVPADVVSHLGNGSSDAGAKQLYRMMDKVRAARTGKKSQAKQINPDKYMPA
jgi:hypothetical protein